MKIKYLKLIPLIFLLYSCKILDQPKSTKDLQEINENNLKLMNGSYNVFSTDSTYRTLDDILFKMKGIYNFANLPDSTVKINLEFIDSERLKVSLLKGDEILKMKIRKGRIQDGYFTLNRTLYGTFWFIINALGEQTSRIGLLKNNNITVDTYNGGVSFIVVLPIGGADSELYNIEFERKK
jgi:hypothetical protein